MHASSKIRIATRKSRLALWQATYVGSQLQAHDKRLSVEYVGITTPADLVLDRALAELGGKALFVGALEQALLTHEADIAVHSMKDVPSLLGEEFVIASILERADPRDVLVSARYGALEDLPKGANVGSSSPRRSAQLLAWRRDLQVKLLRGNVDSRLKKAFSDEYDAIVLASAGLHRLGLEAHIRAYLPTQWMLPSAGQGALGVECLSKRQDLIERVSVLNSQESAFAVTAERAMVAALKGDCHSAIGALAQFEQSAMKLSGMVLNTQGTERLLASATDLGEGAKALGERVAEDLLRQGAADLLV